MRPSCSRADAKTVAPVSKVAGRCAIPKAAAIASSQFRDAFGATPPRRAVRRCVGAATTPDRRCRRRRRPSSGRCRGASRSAAWAGPQRAPRAPRRLGTGAGPGLDRAGPGALAHPDERGAAPQREDVAALQPRGAWHRIAPDLPLRIGESGWWRGVALRCTCCAAHRAGEALWGTAPRYAARRCGAGNRKVGGGAMAQWLEKNRRRRPGHWGAGTAARRGPRHRVRDHPPAVGTGRSAIRARSSFAEPRSRGRARAASRRRRTRAHGAAHVAGLQEKKASIPRSRGQGKTHSAPRRAQRRPRARRRRRLVPIAQHQPLQLEIRGVQDDAPQRAGLRSQHTAGQ